ncbi:MAG TPA: ATP-binding protein [Terriglobales bacterium]|nr:ATP-binding protein [Terriglobales bacterium]
MDLALRSAFMAEGSTLLILLAGAVLLYRSFREKYLIPWLAGWTAYSLAKLFLALHQTSSASPAWLVLAYSAYVLAIWLFTAAILAYVYRKDLRWPAGVLLSASLSIWLLHHYRAPHSTALLIIAFALLRLVLLGAAILLARFAWGRPQAGRWLLAAMVLLIHFDPGTPAHIIIGQDVLLDLLLGLGMMMTVMDDSSTQIERLDVLNHLMKEISEVHDFESTYSSVLAELIELTGARAAWFRIIDGENLVMAAAQGLPEEMASRFRTVDSNRSASGQALRESDIRILACRDAMHERRDLLQSLGFNHLLMVPVEGKSCRVGMLVLAMPHFRSHTDNEKKFLKAVAKQLGMAAENQRLAQQVAHSRHEWAGTFDSIPDFILVHDLQFRIVRANQALVDRLGKRREEIVGQLCATVMPGAGGAWQSCPYCEHEGHAGEADPCFGGYSLVSTSSYPGKDSFRGGRIHVIKDITEERAAEERHSSLFNHMHEGVFTSSPAGQVLDCNDAFVQMLGYSSREEILNLDAVKDLYAYPGDRKKFQEEMADQGFVRNFEYQLRRKDGKLVSVIESSFATRDAQGRIERYQGVLMDVTEMKRAEDEIRRRNRELYVLNSIAVAFNQSFDLDEILQFVLLQIIELLSTDTAGAFLFEEETSSLRKQAGCGHRSELAYENSSIVLPADFVETLKRNHVEIIDHEHLSELPLVLQQLVKAEGLRSWMWVVLWRKEKILGVLSASSREARTFNRSEESVLIAVGRQLATTIEKIQLYHETRRAYEDLRRTQEQLLQSEKMSAVGQLISGVAHELNNPLTAILGYTQLLESESLEPRVADFILKLHKQAQRTHKIVQNLLSFARQHKPSRIEVDMRTVLEDAIALRDYDLKINNILVEREFDDFVPQVIADPHQLEQVYLNIINNAADAIMESGRGGRLQIRLYGNNSHVVAEFHDSGPGIKDPKHVFDPFYTTKGVGKGTGLGLSICYGIVKEHGGEISAHNHTSGGAVLTVRIPTAVGEPPMTEKDRIVARRQSNLQGRVLLVDDEEAVLDFEREVLSAAGLKVTTATSGASALERLASEQFDAVFLDSKMPGEWSSEDIYRQIESEWPELLSRTVLVLSNLSDPAVREFVNATRIACLVKPFEVPDLLAMARRVIRGARAAAAR